MTNPLDNDALFAGSVPELYDRHLVPLIFEEYADDLATRLTDLADGAVLELACGTGVVTRALAARLSPVVDIVATDLNQGMIDRAATIGTARRVDWRPADAQDLPFEDGTFDAVVCQFGVMFFPDKAQAFAESRRVLRPGGRLLFNTWGPLRDNEFADVVTDAVGRLYPSDPPLFLDRTPHGYHDDATIRRELAAAGFESARATIEDMDARSTASLASHPAVAYCQGTPLRDEILDRDPDGLERATEAATAAITARFGPGPVDGRISGLIVTATC